MNSPLTRAYVARVDDVDAKDRSLVARINTSALDRYSTVIDPRGIGTKNYNQNRVVLWEHGRDPVRGSMPVGRNERLEVVDGPDGPELLAKTRFYEKGAKGDEFTERLFQCYKDGDMRAFSVHVVPDESRSSAPTADEIRERPELRACGMMYRGSDLAEYSAVAVPGNPEALTVDEARSILRCVSRGVYLGGGLIAQAARVTRDAQAQELWSEVYLSRLTQPRIGPWANATVRATAHVVRLSMLYAALDRSRVVKRNHLERALAFWDYCDRSARYLFDDSDESEQLTLLVSALAEGPLTRTQIRRQVFSGHVEASDLDRLLAQGTACGRLQQEAVRVNGRMVPMWSAK